MEELINALKAWQSDSENVHPLTCGNDSTHAPLVPVSDGGNIILKCSDCDYVQKFIPDVVLER